MKRHFVAVASAVLAATLLGLMPQASAQTIDPKVLQQVQGQLGVGTTNNTAASQVDRARESIPNSMESLPLGTKIDTTEEQQLRREQSRVALAKIYRASPIEREFRARLADPTLRQFGYELFQSVQDAAGIMTGSAGDSYVVGFGDELVVQFQGATNDSKTVRVDREGRLIVGALPPIPAAGRSLGAVRNDLEAATRRTMLGTEVFVSLGSVRSITVFVGGEVERPGQVGLTALADISAALARAGGIRPEGEGAADQAVGGIPEYLSRGRVRVEHLERGVFRR